MCWLYMYVLINILYYYYLCSRTDGHIVQTTFEEYSLVRIDKRNLLILYRCLWAGNVPDRNTCAHIIHKCTIK